MQDIYSIKPKVLVFDVYETLLDMADLERKINQLLESKIAYRLWFELFMQYCFANNSLDTHQDFMAIANATLRMTGSEVGKPLSQGESLQVILLLKHLPVYEEVQSSLSELNDLGYTIVGLTSSRQKIVYERMERTGSISYFEKFSALTPSQNKNLVKYYISGHHKNFGSPQKKCS